MEEKRKTSLSWLIVSTRDYKKEYDWILNKKDLCCYGVHKAGRTDDLYADLAREYKQDASCFSECVLMPELQMLSIDEAAEYLRGWCSVNNIIYSEDLEQYNTIERHYWGYDD